MYDWEIRRTDATHLETSLEAASANGWDMFAILPAGETANAPLTGEFF